MIQKFLIAIPILVCQVSCTKGNNTTEESLNGQWRIYTIAIVKIDGMENQNACLYETKVSDLYSEPNYSSCNSDDIYEFVEPNALSIKSGTKKCSFDEPNVVTKHYEQKEDSIITDDLRYNIVFLSRDTLILDYCSDNKIYTPNTTVLNKAKLAIKFVRVK